MGSKNEKGGLTISYTSLNKRIYLLYNRMAQRPPPLDSHADQTNVPPPTTGEQIRRFVGSVNDTISPLCQEHVDAAVTGVDSTIDGLLPDDFDKTARAQTPLQMASKLRSRVSSKGGAAKESVGNWLHERVLFILSPEGQRVMGGVVVSYVPTKIRPPVETFVTFILALLSFLLGLIVLPMLSFMLEFALGLLGDDPPSTPCSTQGDPQNTDPSHVKGPGVGPSHAKGPGVGPSVGVSEDKEFA